MLMHDFKKVRGYNPILFLRTAIERAPSPPRAVRRELQLGREWG
jgi:hypothetical protein